MEHLTCLSRFEIVEFIKTTNMKVVSATPETIILQGEKLFTYLFNPEKNAYCLTLLNQLGS